MEEGKMEKELELWKELEDELECGEGIFEEEMEPRSQSEDGVMKPYTMTVFKSKK